MVAETVPSTTAQCLSLSVVDLTGTSIPITIEAGKRIYEGCLPYIEKGIPVTLDFSGVEMIVSGVCNHSIGRLYAELGAEKASKLLSVIGVGSELVQSKIDYAITLGSNPKLVQSLEKAFDLYLQSEK
jgi:hypothetical protein